MTIWEGEIKELDKLYDSFKGHLPDIMKEMEQLIRTDDANVVMLYSRRCLEVIITDLCENELKRPRKTEPLKGIIDKLNSEEKVPSYIITSMQSLNSMATYGTHPKDFDPEQVKPVLINLAIVIRWYLKYKDFKIISKTETAEEKHESKDQVDSASTAPKLKKRSRLLLPVILLGIVIVIIAYFIAGRNKTPINDQEEAVKTKTIDSIDNYIYRTVKIGNQTWIAENLKTTRYNDGTLIPLVTDSTVWENLKTPAYCWYNNDEAASKTPYGALYNWYAASSTNICPSGWHTATNDEYDAMEVSIGLAQADINIWGWRGTDHGSKMKNTTGWNAGENGTNTSGFSALPGGYRFYDDGMFNGQNTLGYWWTATEHDAARGWYRRLDGNNTAVYKASTDKRAGKAIRCVKD